VRTVLVAVTLDHRKILVAADALDRWQVDAGLYQVRDGGMAQRVADHLLYIEARCNHATTKRLVQIDRAPLASSRLKIQPLPATAPPIPRRPVARKRKTAATATILK